MQLNATMWKVYGNCMRNEIKKNVVLYLEKPIVRKIKCQIKVTEWCTNSRLFPFDRSQKQHNTKEVSSWNLKFYFCNNQLYATKHQVTTSLNFIFFAYNSYHKLSAFLLFVPSCSSFSYPISGLTIINIRSNRFCKG